MPNAVVQPSASHSLAWSSGFQSGEQLAALDIELRTLDMELETDDGPLARTRRGRPEAAHWFSP